MAEAPYTYADEWDWAINSFSIEKDRDYFIPIIKQAIEINPRLQIVATGWSAPGWLKYDNTLNGSEFNPKDTDLYAWYLARYVQEYKREGNGIFKYKTCYISYIKFFPT